MLNWVFNLFFSDSKSRLRMSLHFVVDSFGIFLLICMMPFSIAFISIGFDFPAEGLPNIPGFRLDVSKGAHLGSSCLQSFIFLFGGLCSFTIRGNRFLSLAPTSQVFLQPLAVGPPILNHQQESPSARGGRGHGPQHAGKPC